MRATFFYYFEARGIAREAGQQKRSRSSLFSSPSPLFFQQNKNKAHPPRRRRQLLRLLPRPFEVRNLPARPQAGLWRHHRAVALAPRRRSVVGRQGAEIRIEGGRRRRLCRAGGRRRRGGTDRGRPPARRGYPGLDCGLRLADDRREQEAPRGAAAAGRAED